MITHRQFWWLTLSLLLMSGRLAYSEPMPPAACEPEIWFTAVPAHGTTENLSGRVACVDTAVYKVVVYIKVGSGWWVKPTFLQPTTPIQPDGTWTTDITTGGLDTSATQIAAFLIPISYSPPSLGGSPAIPTTLFDDAAAYAYAPRAERQISFSGYEWLVKQSDNLVGPGPNYFSDATDAVWVDDDGRLHLKIQQQEDGHWVSAEVYTQLSLGYGRYLFQTSSPIDQLDANAVLGLFTWDDFSPSDYNREIDIEFARWGDAADPTNAQFVVQPWDQPGNLMRYTAVLTDTAATHSFNWQPDSVTFFSAPGHTLNPNPPDAFATWVYTDTTYIPDPATVNVHLNLWLLNGSPPTNSQPIEVIIEAFYFLSEEVYLPVVLRP